ncbi:pickpocket protein 28-like [Diabrotica undecimpunctata]|uniref:pickpocket protein 28-like n=1 Tax=Diabrotica undecimpunctata TaxID=50387 RepID=UPI003B639FCA
MKSGKFDFDIEEEERRQKEKHYTWVENCKYYILEYCREGSLHGLKYLGQNRTFAEKIWWAISMIISLYICTKLVLNAYSKWQNTPVIVSFATKDTPNWRIPFPAVTICPEIKAVPSKYNYTHFLDLKMKGETLNPIDEARFGYLSLACRRTNKHIEFAKVRLNSAQKEDIYSFLDWVQPDFFSTISHCQYMGYEENCTDLFTPIITDEGICYSFNILDRSQIFKPTVEQYKDFHRAKLSNWTIENGYSLDDGAITYPRRALYAGAIFSLEGVLTVKDEDLDYSCGSSIQGFKIEISHPGRLPRVRQQHFRVPLDQVVVAAINPSITTTASAIKRYPPKKRNCYFPNEKQLQYFVNYTQMDCQIECKTNHTLKQCGCVDFYMPRERDVPVCSEERINCIFESERELLLSNIEKKLHALKQGKIAKDKCDCMPICTSMYYNLETSQATWDWQAQFETNDKQKHMSSFQIYFKSNQFVTMERNELFGITDFLANFGGLLGLFVGFSLLSLIEIVYFLTLRIFCNVALFGRHNWSGIKE